MSTEGDLKRAAVHRYKRMVADDDGRCEADSLSARPCSLALTTGCQTRAQDAEATRLVVRSITSLQSILQNAANCNVRSYPKADIYRWLGNVR